MGAGLFQTYALKVMPNGDLYAGGYFPSSGTNTLNYIARWDGTEWVPLGTGMNNDVDSLGAAANGDLIAGGRFGTSGGVVTSCIAQWDGSVWSGFGSGLLPVAGPRVGAIAVLTNGNMVIGGNFAHVGSTNVIDLALWNGSTWGGVGSGTGATLSPDVSALLALPDGGFVVGGSFAAINGHVSNCFGHWGCPISQPSLTGFGLGPLGLQFSLQGTTGWTYGVQYSTNLQNWLALTSGLSGTVIFQDNDPSHRSLRSGYYRVVQE